jgi:hypothetical protein
MTTGGAAPLALEQACAYMEAKGRSLVEYEQLFGTHQQELLRRDPPSEDYPATVATTWELAFQQIADASPAGSDLLHLCAFLAPDNIPRELLSSGAEHLPQPLADTVADPLAFDDAVELLRRYSLIEASAGVGWAVCCGPRATSLARAATLSGLWCSRTLRTLPRFLHALTNLVRHVAAGEFAPHVIRDLVNLRPGSGVLHTGRVL